MEIANLLNYRFSTLGEFIGLQQTNNIPPKTAPRKCFNFRYITTKETNVLIDSLNTSKPVGPSKIPAWAIKDAKAALAEPLCYLINQFITEGKFPEDLKKACVTPLFKKGNPEDPLNYRPISVTSALSKNFEKAFSSQITSFLEREQLLSASQFGYRKQISTIDAILKSTEQIRLELNKKKNVTGSFLDLSKAFDSINHKILLRRLENIGFDEHATNLVENYLSKRTQRVVLNGIESDWINLKRGVPQGTILGPLLFNIYVNDLAKIVEEDCTVVQYADDTFLFTSDTDEISAKTKLEHNISKIIDFFAKSQLVVNKQKTEYIVFSTRKRLTNTVLNVDNERIAESISVKYLGVIIDSKLKFDGEVKKILQRMACGIKVLNTLSKSLPQKTKVLLLNAIVISHLHYSALILIGLQKSLLTTLEKQLNWGIKSIFNRRKYDRSTDLKLRNKILPVSFLLKYRCSKYFIRLLSNDLPAYKIEPLSTMRIKQHDRSKKVTFDIRKNNKFLTDSFIAQAIPIYNSLPSNIRLKTTSKASLKKQLKEYFWKEFLKDPKVTDIKDDIESIRF